MLTRKPPSHPDETQPLHKANLVRNLDRNDAEIAALVRCNRSLRTVRDEIRSRYGEDILLDVGEGTVRLKTGELGSAVRPAVVRVVPGVVLDADGHRRLVEERVAQVMRERALRAEGGAADIDEAAEAEADADAEAANDKSAADTEEGNDGETEPNGAVINTVPPDEVPLDDPDHASDPTNPTTRTNLLRAFLLHQHLRRRILNRLFRRMNRLARAMDGESAISSGLNGPTPPRYGDFRFLLDEGGDAFVRFGARFRRRAEARRHVERRRGLRRNEEIGAAKPEQVEVVGEGEDDGGDDEVMAEANAKPEEAPTASTGTSTSGTSSSPSDVAKLIVPQEDEADLNVLLETEVGRDKMVTYQDLAKPLRALGGTPPPTKSKTPSKKSPASKMDVEEEEEEKKDGPAPTAKTDAVAADIAAEGPPSAIEVKAEAEQSPTENVGVVANGTSDSAAAAVKADDDDKKQENEEEEVPPLPELVPGMIRKIVTLPLAASDPPPEERDFSSSKFTAAGGGGIGALSRSMNSREREVEYNRWKADVLAKVPEQPTFAELGLENRVFRLEARRKKAAAATAPSTDGDDKMEVDDKDAASAADDDAMDVDDDSKGEDESKKRSADDAEETKAQKDEDEDDNGATDKSKEEAKKEKIKRPEIFKKKKLISLAAAPSFHSQDQHRIRAVHKDLLVRSRMEKAQKMLDDANAAYNKAFALSTDVHNQKNQRTNDLNVQSTQTRNVETHAKLTTEAEAGARRALWQKAYQQWMSRRMQAGLAVPPMPVEQNAPLPASPATAAAAAQIGSSTTGTPLTAAKSLDSAATEEEREAASALGAVVDKVAGGDAGEKKEPIYNDPSVLANVPADAENFPPFIVPPMNADLAAAVDKERKKEAALRKGVTEDSAKLHAAEEERKKAWRQMLKLKGELTTLTTGGGGGGGSKSQRRRVTASRRAPAPAPAASSYRAQAPAARAPAASAYTGHSAVYGQAQQVQNYAQSLAVYQKAQQASAAGTARAPAAAANYYGYAGYAPQQQQYIPTQQTSRPGMPTAPTGTMAMAAASAAATVSSAAQQQVTAQATQQALATYQTAQVQQPQVQVADAAAAPVAASTTNSATHQARYSQTAIRNRTYNDGSVAPAVPPKRGEDGLFQRPSGRSRKGMDWDGVHGVWRPTPGGDNGGAGAGAGY